jgi:hypothetical protein
MGRNLTFVGTMLAGGLASVGAASAAPPPLTADGWGALRIGMPESEAVRRFGLVSTAVDGDCHAIEFTGRIDLTGMARNGRIASLVAGGESRLRTDRGLRIGSTEAEVRRAYGAGLMIEPNAFEEPPAHYLTYWVRPNVRGVMYETDVKGRVVAIHAGDETIGWTDGCG